MLNIYSIRDDKAEAYLQPFFATNTAVAIRMIQNSVNSQDHSFALHPHDYHLFEHGEFNELDGIFVTDYPKRVASISEILKVGTMPTDQEIYDEIDKGMS